LRKSFVIFLIILLVSPFAFGDEDSFLHQRYLMVKNQIERRGIADQEVLDAMAKVKRHLFVPRSVEYLAYQDSPLPIGYEQTISQPYIVAYMTEAAKLKKGDKVLEIGTGSGYQAAILAEIVKEVYTIEIIKPLAEASRERLKRMGYKNIHVKHGDGYQGWTEFMPYDAIIVTAAPKKIPEHLIEQLKVGGRMVIPIGSFYQELYLITKTGEGIHEKALLPVRFVPMVKED